MKSILTKLSEEEYLELYGVMKELGFHSFYDFMKALIRIFLANWKRIRYKRDHPDEVFVTDEVDEIFKPFEFWQESVYGDRSKRGHVSWDKFNEQTPVQGKLFNDEVNDGKG